MTVVIDASVAIKWVLREAGSDAALTLRSESLIAPAFWLSECANILWKNVQRKRLTEEFALRYFRRLLNSPVSSRPDQEDLPKALELAVRLDQPVYDCVYLALALRHDTYVITADVRFIGACMKDGGFAKNVQLLAGA